MIFSWREFCHFFSWLELNKTNMSEVRLQPVVGQFFTLSKKTLEWSKSWNYSLYNYTS